ncbi:nucleotidyltransferase domain-containing protein [Azospirillum halopraeferens]|uniref:nucleotidyltransferase domain-containing protein n=1 Tax=Azospirillum halopraeferens TaxID=34010 RepID=UPI00041911F9|nr:nucleotidyltransferase family protein [Azospirillum halopraeferens]
MTEPFTPAVLPAEVRFLLGVVAAGFGGQPPRPEPGMNRADVVAAVRHHRLEPWLGPALAPDLPVPGDARRHLSDLRRQAAMRALRLTAEVARIVPALEAAGVEVLVLKGPALAVQLHGDPTRRSCRDIDLLVRPEAAAAARAALAALGYGVAPDMVAAGPNALTLHHAAAAAAPVELHDRLADDDRLLPMAAVDPFGTAVTVTVGGMPVRTLSPAAALVYGAWHGAKHHWSRLYWLADVAAAADHPAVDWREAADLARRTGTERHLALAARLSTVLLGRAPAAAPPPDAPTAAALRRAEAILPAILALPPVDDREGVRRAGSVRVLRAELALCRRWSARRGLLVERLRPTDTDRALLALPAGLGGLYYGVRLTRVLGTALRHRLQAMLR